MKREFFLISKKKKKKIYHPWYFKQMEIFVSYSYIAFLFSYTLFYNNHMRISQLLSETCRYSEFFWSECVKIRTRKTPNTDTFYAVTR